MKDDDDLLEYFEIHSRTERGLFHRDMIIRLCILAGEELPDPLPEWIAVHSETGDRLVKKARARKLLRIVSTAAFDGVVVPLPNVMDALGGPRCACGRPSTIEDGSCDVCVTRQARFSGNLIEIGARPVTLRPCPFCLGADLAFDPDTASIMCVCTATGPSMLEAPYDTDEEVERLAGIAWNGKDAR